MFSFRESRYNFAAMILIAAAVFVSYANGLNGDFVCDDRPIIVDNYKIASAEYVPEYFKKGLWENTEIKKDDKYLYRPLLLVEFYLFHTMWGGNAFGYHLVNVLLHAVNSILVFLLLKYFFKGKHLFVPLAGALFFAVHPVHSEAVSWIVGHNDLLLSFAVMAAFLCYISYHENKKSIYLAAALLLSFIAMLVKEVALLFPALVLAFDFAKDKKSNAARLSLFMIPVIATVMLRLMALGGAEGTLQFSRHGLGLLFEFTAAYLKLLFLPWPLAFYFVRPAEGFIGGIGIFVALLALIMLIALLRKQKKLLFGLAWCFLTLLPPLMVAFHLKPHIMERVLYLPSVGFTIAVTGLIALGFEKYRKVTAGIVLALVFIFGLMTIQANKDWKNDEVFYAKAVKNNPGYGGAYIGLGMFYERQGNIQKAIDLFLQAARHVSGEDAISLYGKLGSVYGKNGFVEKSILYFNKVIEADGANSSALAGIGNNYWARKEYQKALSFYLKAFSVDKSNYEACYNIALTYETLGDMSRAVMYYNEFAAAAPTALYSGAIESVRNKLAQFRNR